MSEISQKTKGKLLALCSGGLDSSVMLHKLSLDGNLSGALFINYAQRHLKEIEFARANCEKLKITLDIADISAISGLFGKNSLTDPEIAVPRKIYAEDNMLQTVVPNRNMIFISIAAARAISLSCDGVAYAAHSGDHSIYPDCREEFAESLGEVLKICHYTPISLKRPFVNMSKAEIVKLGAQIGVDFSQTWSCYEGGKIHCGLCATCRERKQAFIESGVADPTIYES